MHTTVPSRFPIHKISTTVITLPRKRFLMHRRRRNIVGPHTGASYDAYNQHQSPHLQSWANFFSSQGLCVGSVVLLVTRYAQEGLPLVSQGARLRARFFFI
jgi:hypothetical protein